MALDAVRDSAVAKLLRAKSSNPSRPGTGRMRTPFDDRVMSGQRHPKLIKAESFTPYRSTKPVTLVTRSNIFADLFVMEQMPFTLSYVYR